MPGATRRLPLALFLTPLCTLFFCPPLALAGDWPQWRFDATRSAASPDELPAKLKVAWSRQLPRLKPAWPDQPKLQFDVSYEPIVVGERLFIGSPHDGSLTAYDTRTGSEAWRFFADGPIRFAPLTWQEKLYVVSDDGYLYCLRIRDGSLLWRFRGGPSGRKVLGNEHLVSMWPARGAPVIEEGKVYFAAGIWPFMGIFIHALDAASGQVVWTSDGDGSVYIKQPHNTDSFAGVAPQGPLVAIGNKLLIPGGRSVPAVYDRASGKLLCYQLAENGKKGGGFNVSAYGKVFFNGGAIFDLETEKQLASVGDLLAFAEGKLYDYGNKELRTHDLSQAGVATTDTVDRKGEKTPVMKWTAEELGVAESPRLTALIKAGSRLYAGCEGGVLAFSLPLAKRPPPEDSLVPIPAAKEDATAWELDVAGTPISLIAADDRLFVVTREGQLYCLATDNATVVPTAHQLTAKPLATDGVAENLAQAWLKASGVSEGYCLVIGAGSGQEILSLAAHSNLRITVFEPNENAASELREAARASGLGGDRVSVLVEDPVESLLPPYVASLIVVQSLPKEDKPRAELLSKIFASLRPFGGVACLPVPTAEFESFTASVKPLPLVNAAWKQAGETTLLVREGALPDSANWTHEHADAANTRVSKDKLVKTPLGLLWFGGSTNDSILPRHGHGPQPQVVDGRVFIEGPDSLRAMDIYTGRVLWEVKLPELGALFDNTAHQPGANASGSNYIALPDGVYVAYGRACLKLAPATGRKLGEYQLPGGAASVGNALRGVPEVAPLWGYLNAYENVLIGGADPLFDPSLMKKPPKGSNGDDKPLSTTKVPALVEKAEDLLNKAFKTENDNYSASQRLVVLDRTTGHVLWTAVAKSGFRHNAICLGGGRLYCIDRLSGAQLSRLKRRGEEPPHPPRLIVFDLKTGRELWSTVDDVFGTWLSYSSERDVLVEAGRNARDTLGDEPKGMRAYRASAGNVLWTNKNYTGPAMIHHDDILLAGSACDLLTGAQRMRKHPLTGEPIEWTWSRNYGCDTPVGSEHLLTFRSGTAGYLDFCNDGGTGNFGGFRSSCTNNLIVAGGVLCAPDYTRTCTCSYQNQTSLALVHMPEVETWTFFGSQTPKEAVRRLGINLAAPGDRKADDGTLWLEFPSVGGASPPVAVKVQPEKPEWFRRHSSQISGSSPAWIAASGAKGLTSLRVKLAGDDDPVRKYKVRLHFAEPDDVLPGERLFSVRLQGQEALATLDVVKEAGGKQRSLVKEFAGIQVDDDLLIELRPDKSAKVQAALLCGVELLADGW